MADIHTLANAIIRMEGSDQPNSINQRMVREFGRWNVGHLVWAGQRNAVPVYLRDRNWAGWPTREASYEGLLNQIRLDASRGLTLEQFIHKYAPASENPTSQYLSNIEAWTGADRKTMLASIVSGPGGAPAAPTDPGTPGTPGGGVVAAGLWTPNLADALNSTLGTTLAPEHNIWLLAGGAALLLILLMPSRRPAY